MIERSELLDRIRENIDKHGYHVTLVTGKILPRFGYTIGCEKVFGSELIFAGGELYPQSAVSEIFEKVAAELKNGADWQSVSISVNSFGSFSLSRVNKSWSKLLAIGAIDFYNKSEIEVLQILPDKAHRTLDVPNMEDKFDVDLQPVWQWLVREWDYTIPRDSIAVTNLKVLYGEKATEVMRWETNEWEIFSGAGPEIPIAEMRTVPLAILLGIDKSLEPVTHLKNGKGLWRDLIEMKWNNWE